MLLLGRLPRIFILLFFFACPLNAADVKNLRLWHGPDKSRLVFDLSEPIIYNVYELSNPERLVIDMENVIFNSVLPDQKTVGPYLHRIRQGIPHNGVLRIVLDLKTPVRSSITVHKPNDVYGHRLVIDLSQRFPQIDAVSEKKEPGSAVHQPTVVNPSRKVIEKKAKPIMVVIDAGHGGEDPGAVGSKKTREKNVVLSIAKKLERAINTYPGMVARLTRNGDYYISLRERTNLARKADADLFISIHADGFYKKTARGMSVYALSNKGATSETARWLADKENASDLIGGISLHDKDDMLAQVLLDLSMSKTVSDSIAFARFVLKNLRTLGPVHSEKVEQAGFAVLKSPDIPSILVETGYITNPREEKLLRSSRYQQKLANAIATGVNSYIKNGDFALNNQVPAQHVVKTGDSLSVIAQKYNTSVNQLKKINGIDGNQINVGQKLRLRE